MTDFFPEVDDREYSRLQVLGRGGFGTTYLATEPGGREVVIKELHPSRNAFRDRFELEARSLATLDHPNIVRALRLGRWRTNQRLFFVMTHVRGTSYAEVIDDLRGLPRHRADYQVVGRILDALLSLRDAASGLAYAHEQGLVHRDVKPSNLVTDGGRATLVDWGLVASVGSSSEPAGSPFYFSKEQAAGDPASPAMDVYAVGACLYELMTGAPPLRASHDRTLSFNETRAIAMTERPLSISHSEPMLDEVAKLAMQCIGPVGERPAMAALLQQLDGLAQRCVCVAHKQVAERSSAKRVLDGWLCNACRLEFTLDGKPTPAVALEEPRTAQVVPPVTHGEGADVIPERVLSERDGIRSTLGRDGLGPVVIEELLPEASDHSRVRFAHAVTALGTNTACFPGMLRAAPFIRRYVEGTPLAAHATLDDDQFALLLAAVAAFCRAVLELHDRGFSSGVRPERVMVTWSERTCKVVAVDLWNVEKLAFTFSAWADPDPARTRDLDALVDIVATLIEHPAAARERYAPLRRRIQHDIARNAGIHSLLQGIELAGMRACSGCRHHVPAASVVLTGSGYLCSDCIRLRAPTLIHHDERELEQNRRREQLTAAQIAVIVFVILLPFLLQGLTTVFMQLAI